MADGDRWVSTPVGIVGGPEDPALWPRSGSGTDRTLREDFRCPGHSRFIPSMASPSDRGDCGVALKSTLLYRLRVHLLEQNLAVGEGFC